MAKAFLGDRIPYGARILATGLMLLAMYSRGDAASTIYQQSFDNLTGGPTAGTPYKDVANVSGLPKGTGDAQWQFKTQSWTSGGTDRASEGLIQLTRNFTPNGPNAEPNPAVLILHDQGNGETDAEYSLNEAILTLDLTGYTNIVLSFMEYDSQDNQHNNLPNHFYDSNLSSLKDNPWKDGVSVSSNGRDWYALYNPPDHNDTWKTIGPSGIATSTSYVIPTISALIASVGNPALLSASSSFKIKFQQYDNAYHGTDGRKYDNILITGSRPPGGAAPEPATAVMFGLGFAGMAVPALRRRFSRNAKKSAA